ncbi:MAG: AIR synthase-related protein, partial [Erysipelotrichales bacterium]
EMPSVYEEGGFDLAGFVVGAVEKEDMIDNTNLVKPNQVIIGLPSSGIHSNGYSLVNKIVKDENLDLMKQYEGLDTTLGEALLCPTKLYVNETLELLDNVKVKAMAHITGGGFYENIKRATHKYGAKINLDNIDILPIFNFLQDKGHLELMEMFSYFNMGIGMIYIIDEIDVDKTLSLLKGSYVIGEVTSQEDIVIC